MFDFHDPIDLLYAVVILALVVSVASFPTWLIARLFLSVHGIAMERQLAARATRANTELVEISVERARLDNDLIRPDANGVLPIHRAAVLAATDQILALMALRQDIQRPVANVPQTFTYSPHVIEKKETPAPPPPAPPAITVMDERIPTTMECYRRGLFDDPEMLHIGFDQNMQPLFSPIEDTYGVGVAGVPKMGKTTGMRYWALQMAYHGARVAMIDPAANSRSQQGLAADMSGLRRFLWEQPASDPDDVVRMLTRIEAMGIARNKGQDVNTWPLMLMIDEMTSLVTGERGDEIANLIKRITRQYRKEHIYTIAAGQDWLGDALGSDVGLRRAFVCKAVYRVDPENGRKLMVRKPLIDMVSGLQRGQMIWLDASANQNLVTVPDCTALDVAAVLANSGPAGSPSHTGKELLPVPSAEVTGKQAGSEAEVDGEVILDAGKRRQIEDYGAQGWSTHKIAKVVFGVEGGRAYNDARQLINQILGREL